MTQNKKIFISIVEDFFLHRVGLEKSLSMEEGFDISGVYDNAEDCIKDLESFQPDVILMDLGLANMNGIEATKIIKEKYPDIKVIILTSHESEEQTLACLASGANAYCLKEISAETLVAVIKSVNDGAIWLDPKIAKVAYSIVPQPNSTDFDNLYPNNASDANLLTAREMLVLKYMVQGLTNAEIANEIYISPHTAKAHVGSILSKLAVSDRVQAAVKAIRSGLVR